MRRIVVSLLKGGVAKSETAVSLAHGMAMRGLKVLLVDTDVQAQCSDMLGIYPERGLAQVIAGWPDPDGVLAEARENLWLLAGGNDLAGVKMEIARREMSPESVLDEALQRFQDRFDVMIIDTAPGWDTLLVNALFCSREVLSPVSMEPMALSGLQRFEERLSIIQKYNPQLVLRWIIPTFVDGRVKKTAEILRQLKERYGELIGPSIKYSVKLSEAPAFGKTIYEHDPKGVGAKAYHALTERIMADAPAQRAARPRPSAAEAPSRAVAGKVSARVISPRPAQVQTAEATEAVVAAVAARGRTTGPEGAPVSAAETSPPETIATNAAAQDQGAARIKKSPPVLRQRLRRDQADDPGAPAKTAAQPESRPGYASLRDRLGRAQPGRTRTPAGVKKRSPYLSLKERLQRGSPSREKSAPPSGEL